jgi:hypothetical protein
MTILCRSFVLASLVINCLFARSIYIQRPTIKGGELGGRYGHTRYFEWYVVVRGNGALDSHVAVWRPRGNSTVMREFGCHAGVRRSCGNLAVMREFDCQAGIWPSGGNLTVRREFERQAGI